MAEDVVGQIYDPDKNQLPDGGVVDANGRIVWAVTEEEAKAMKEKMAPRYFLWVNLGCLKSLGMV